MSVTQEVLRAAAVAVGALLVAGAFGGLLFAGAQSLRRAAVLPLAVRYAGARRIHVVSVLGVAVGVAALIVVLSVMNGLIAEHRRMLRGTLPDLTIRPEPRRDANRAGRMPGAFADYRRALDGAPHVAAIAPRYVYYGLVVPEARGGVFELARKGAWNAVEIRGIDPSLERRVSELDRWLGPVAPDELSGARERPWLFSPVADTADPLKRLERTSGLPKDAMIVGFGLAERLDLARGRRVEVATWTPEGESTASGRTPNMYFDVAGMFHAPEQDFEASTALVTIDAVRKLVSDDDSDFTEIAVRLDDESHAAAAREDAAKRLTGAGLIRSADEIVTWEDQRRPLLAAVENERSLIAILLFFIVVVAIFILFATLSMMVTEKTRDVGILSALGATGAEVSAVFVDVGVAMTIAGEILGLGLGLLVATRLRPIEDFLADRFGLRLFNPDVYLITHLPSEIHGAQIVTLLALTLAAGVLFSLVPAARAARLDPAAALRYE